MANTKHIIVSDKLDKETGELMQMYGISFSAVINQAVARWYIEEVEQSDLMLTLAAEKIAANIQRDGRPQINPHVKRMTGAEAMEHIDRAIEKATHELNSIVPPCK